MNDKIKVLIVEHEPSDIELIQYELKTGKINCTTETVQTEADYINAIHHFEPDVILSDYILPSFDGPTAFKIREEMVSDTPFIFVSGTIGEETAVQLIKNGVTDYVLKDKLFSLVPKIKRALNEVAEKKDKIIIDKKLNKVSRLYAFISQVNQNIIHVQDEATLFHNSCRLAIEFGKFKIAWIGMFDLAEKKIMLVGQNGIPAEEIKLFDNVPYQNKGPQDYVLKSGTYYICNDIANDLELENWKPYAAKHSIQSCMVLPIKKAGNIIGTFNLYSYELNFFDKEELTLLIEVTGDISFAIDLFEKTKRHKESEELIIQNEMRFRALVENGSDAVAILSQSNTINYISPSIQKILGYTEEEFMKFDVLSLFHPNDLADVAKVLEEVMAAPGKPISGCTSRVLHKNGEWRWLEATATNMLHDPAINGIVDNFRDITEKKLADEKLLKSEASLLEAQAIGHIGSWEIDLENYTHIWSNELYNIFGINQDEIQPSTALFLSLIHPNDATLAKEKINKAFDLQQPVSYNFRFMRDGTKKYGYIERKFEYDNNNKLIRAYGIVQDITERREVELKLKKSEAFNRGVIDSLSAHIAVIDNSGNIIAVNEAWKQFSLENGETTLQFTGEGSNYFEVCNKSAKAGDKMAAAALEGMKDVMDEKKTDFYLEYPCHSPNEQQWFAMRVMKFESNEPMVVVAHENITELKEAESERDTTQWANKELEKIKKDLDNALKKEKDLNELKSRFVAMASHEFRTPLTTMLSSVVLIAKYAELSDTENQLKHINKVKKSINNLTDILNNFLSVSKLEEGKIENKPEKINLKNFITETIAEMELMVLNKQKLVLEYTGSEIGFVDKKVLKNIFHNLISNAIKFSYENGLIEIAAKSLKSSIEISVKDNGIGISNEDQTHLFERFFRGHNATHIQGTGLGLSIVTKYLEQMNGSISFESKEGKGTIFTITIPQ